jgi:hypothetical protein
MAGSDIFQIGAALTLAMTGDLYSARFHTACVNSSPWHCPSAFVLTGQFAAQLHDFWHIVIPESVAYAALNGTGLKNRHQNRRAT